MITPLLWFGLMPPGGTGNIFIEMTVRRNNRERFVEPCPLAVKYTDTHSWPYISRCVPYVETIEKSYSVGWRNMSWENHFLVLDRMVESHAPLHTWAASFNLNTFQKIQNYYGSSCLTVSINYNENDYDFMRAKWARWQTGLVMSNPTYQKFKNKFTDSHEIESYLLEHGSKEFGYELPRSKITPADIEIPLRDLFDKTQMANILNKFNTQPTPDDWKFYDSYCQVSG